MRNKSKVAALMAVLTSFALIAAIAPTALAGQSQVFFSDVNGNPKAQWSIGETLYVTVVAHNENRDDAKVEFIDASKECQTHTQVSVPCIEVWNPNTKDSESNYGALVLVETGANSGIFRSQTGLQILPIEEDPDYQENGTIQAWNGDTLAVRYQGPSDDTDISLDLAKVNATDATVRLTNQAGQSQPMWRLGQHVYVTVEDADANLDSRKPDTLKGVTLWNPRCVWDALERQGSPRSDQPQPKPCEGTIAYDSALKNILGQQQNVTVGDSLVLEETGPDTGVFRNINGIRINDNFAEQGERQLFVNHKDTIAAFYRHPAIVGGKAPEPPEPETRTDRAENENFVFERTYPTSVQPGETFTVSVRITVKQDTQAAVLREGLPGGFNLASGNLRTVELNLSSGQSFTHTYEVTAGPTPGTFQIRGVTLDGSGVRPLPLTSSVTVAAGGQAQSAGLNAASVSAQAENSFISYNRSISGTPAPGGSFQVDVNVEAKQDLRAVTVSENLGGLTLASGSERAVELNLASGETFTHTYTAQCPAGGGSFTISGEATAATGAGSQSPLTETTSVDCSGDDGGGQEPPTGVTGFYRGKAGYNDYQDFAMAQAKVGHLNPANLTFTDQNGNEIDEIEFGQDFFLTMEDTDQNIDSDHVETLCVQVFDVNGGREGDTPAFHRMLQDQLKDDPRSCLEDHGREFQMFKTGVRLVETGQNTGVFRNPDALKLIPICAMPQEPMYGFETDPNNIEFHIPIHFAENPGTNNVGPGTFEDVDPWWQKVNPRDVLKDCYQTTQYTEEGRAEFNLDAKQPAEDVPGKVAAHAGDALYAVYQDQVVDPLDVVFATTDVADDHTFTGEENGLDFVDVNGNPIEDGEYQVGRDIFVRLEDQDRNVSSDVNDKVLVLVLDRATGDWENVLLTETGPDTGVFMNQAGLFLQPATSPDEISINNNRLEVFDRDTIEAHYQDNYNSKDYTNTWVRLVPQPQGGPTGPGEQPGGQTTVRFTDAQGTELANAAIGDDVYVTIEAPNASGSSLNVTVTNTRTQESVEATANRTSGNTFRTDAITTGAPGGTADIAVADGDTLEASYQDFSDTLSIVTAEFDFTGATNFPNPLRTTTTFQANGTGIASVTVNVYDLSGRLVNSASASGNSVMWDGTNADGLGLSGGVYLYTISAEGRDGTTATSDVMKLVILR